MKILVTGASGYVGSKLVPQLLQSGHEVVAVDTMWFGNYLDSSRKLQVIESRVGELSEYDLKNIDTVIHLANIANDPSVDLNPVNSWETNTIEFIHLLNLSKTVKIGRFIYASSGSVYGVKEELRVTEDLSLTPISTYNKTKMVAERIALSFAEFFDMVILRPATVCGLSRRMRFDVVVNLFVLQAFKSNLIRVTGGDQIRPNIHIDDMVDVYCHFLNASPGLTGIYNAGFENFSISEIANKVSQKAKCEIELVESNDPRSYRQDSTKLLSTGFTPRRNVEQAIEDVYEALSSGKLKDDPRWHTVEWMKSNNI